MAAPASNRPAGTEDFTFDLSAPGSFTPLPTNWYTLTVEKVTLRDREADKFHTEPYKDVEFQFVVSVNPELREELDLGDEPIPRRAWANMVRTFSPRATLTKILTALGAVNAEDAAQNGVRFDAKALIGRKCLGNIVESTRTDGTLTDSIEGFAPMPKKAKPGAAGAGKPPVAARPAVTDDPDDPDAQIPF